MKARSTPSLSGHELEANHPMHSHRSTSDLSLPERKCFYRVHTLAIDHLLSPSPLPPLNIAVKRYLPDRRKFLERELEVTLCSLDTSSPRLL